MDRKKTLITGGRGFIGVNLVPVLSEGSNVAVLDSLHRCSPTGWGNQSSEFIEADILEPDGLESSMRAVTNVVHLAAYGSVVESVADPLRNFQVNALGTLNVLRACVSSGVKKMVFASTGGALIGNSDPPVSESSLPKPISPYGASKLCGEGYCHAFSKAYGMDIVCTRFANVYGPHSTHKKGVITKFIKALIQDQPMVIYGDGSASRDYIFVGDLCEGIRLALDRPVEGGEVFHLASGIETTVLQLAKILCDIAGKPKHPIEFRPARSGEVVRNFASTGKAKQHLGFAPRMALRDGLTITWEWFNRQPDHVLAIEATES